MCISLELLMFHCLCLLLILSRKRSAPSMGFLVPPQRAALGCAVGAGIMELGRAWKGPGLWSCWKACCSRLGELPSYDVTKEVMCLKLSNLHEWINAFQSELFLCVLFVNSSSSAQNRNFSVTTGKLNICSPMCSCFFFFLHLFLKVYNL